MASTAAPGRPQSGPKAGRVHVYDPSSLAYWTGRGLAGSGWGGLEDGRRQAMSAPLLLPGDYMCGRAGEGGLRGRKKAGKEKARRLGKSLGRDWRGTARVEILCSVPGCRIRATDSPLVQVSLPAQHSPPKASHRLLALSRPA